MTLVIDLDLDALRASLAGELIASGEDGWDEHRQAFNTAFVQDPALVAVPAAALGLVAPWLAALDMTGSSMAVVLNAMRAGRARIGFPPAFPVERKPATALLAGQRS